MNIFQNAFSTLQLQENTAHELGHVLDLYSAGHNTYSTTYNTKYMTDDQTDLTNDTGTGLYDKGGAKNSPCTKTNGNQAPFDGQTGRTGSVYDDSTNTQVCNETSGAVTIQSPPNTNLALAQDVSPGIIGSGTSYNPNGAPAYLEIFAEAFAWAVYTQGASNPFVYNAPYQEAADGLFANGYYACAVAYAQSAATNTTINPPTGHCK
jgi:hypothetical protein